MKKGIIFLSVLLIFITSLITPASAYNAELDLKADIALLVSLNNSKGTAVISKNPDKKSAPASLTKIITAAVALKNCPDLENTMVTVSNEAIDLLVGTDSSLSGIVRGETLSMLELLYSMMVASGNDAANAIAYHIGNGSIDAFVAKMNELAAELGCTNSSFKNPHGLDQEGHYTTAADMAKFTEYALGYPVFKQICDTAKYELRATNKRPEPTTLLTTNLILNEQTGYYYEYASGVKTGHTDNAGRCVIVTASKDGYEYLGIIMKAPFEDYTNDGLKDNGAFLECVKMFKWAFSHIRYKTICDTIQTVSAVNVENSWATDHVRLVPKETKKMLIPASVSSADIIIEPIKETLPESISAPVEQGQVIGKAKIYYKEKAEDNKGNYENGAYNKVEIGEIEIVAAESAKGSFILTAWSKIKAAVHHWIFKVILGIIGLAIIFVVAVNVIYNYKKKKNRIRVVKDFKNLKK